MNVENLLIVAIGRTNPALAPRWSLARAAVELGLRFHFSIAPVRDLARFAIDSKCDGPGTKARKAVARLAVQRHASSRDDDTLMAYAWPELFRAIANGEWGVAAMDETDPDLGEIRACLQDDKDARSSLWLVKYYWPRYPEGCPDQWERIREVFPQLVTKAGLRWEGMEF